MKDFFKDLPKKQQLGGIEVNPYLIASNVCDLAHILNLADNVKTIIQNNLISVLQQNASQFKAIFENEDFATTANSVISALPSEQIKSLITYLDTDNQDPHYAAYLWLRFLSIAEVVTKREDLVLFIYTIAQRDIPMPAAVDVNSPFNLYDDEEDEEYSSEFDQNKLDEAIALSLKPVNATEHTTVTKQNEEDFSASESEEDLLQYALMLSAPTPLQMSAPATAYTPAAAMRFRPPTPEKKKEGISVTNKVMELMKTIHQLLDQLKLTPGDKNACIEIIGGYMSFNENSPEIEQILSTQRQLNVLQLYNNSYRTFSIETFRAHFAAQNPTERVNRFARPN